jgi:hypothetical protein
VSLQEVAKIAKDADLASLKVSGGETKVGELTFAGYEDKAREQAERELAKKALSESAWALDDSELLAQQIESKTSNKDIREGQLWTQRVLKDRRAELEKQLGEPIARRQGGPAGAGASSSLPPSGGPLTNPAGPTGPTSRPTTP